MCRDPAHPVPAAGPWITSAEIAGDASSRRYRRLHPAVGDPVVEVTYPASEDSTFRRDLEVWRWCQERGLRVPRVYSTEPGKRRALLEDFGAKDAERALREMPPSAREAALARLVTPLAQLAEIRCDMLPAWNPPLGRARLRWELAGFELWAVSHRLGRRPPTALGTWLDELAEEVAGHPLRICHRDYHLNNLFFLADGGVGMIDCQDILLGPDSYDAASLLGDRDAPDLVSDAAAESWLERWARTTAAAGDWRRRWRQVTMQRGLKVLGTFCRLEAAGRADYGRWISPLARRVFEIAEESPGAGSLCDILLHWSASGGPHVR